MNGGFVMKNILSRLKKTGGPAGLTSKPSWLTGQLLVATPGMADPRFTRAVIYICSH